MFFMFFFNIYINFSFLLKRGQSVRERVKESVVILYILNDFKCNKYTIFMMFTENRIVYRKKCKSIQLVWFLVLTSKKFKKKPTKKPKKKILNLTKI